MKQLNSLVGRAFLLSWILFLNPVFAAEDYGSDAYHQRMILHYVNEYRVKHHLKPLKMNATISHEAVLHSSAMARQSIPFGHLGFEGRMKRLYQKMGPGRGGAENVAFYKLDAKKLVEQWLASPGHRRNIEGNYDLTGIGIAHGRPGWAYYTQIFIRRV